jgi:hypothetical protein
MRKRRKRQETADQRDRKRERELDPAVSRDRGGDNDSHFKQGAH